jgi:tetratricopeptide (TPR) repeat protein
MIKISRLWSLGWLPLLFLVVTPQLTFAQTTEQLIQQGNVAQESQRYDEAEQIWRRVIQKQPKNAQAYLNLGDALLGQPGKLQEAIAAYRQAAKLAPKDAQLYNHLSGSARKLREFGFPEAAIEISQLLLQLNPKDANIYLDLGLTYRNQRQHEQAAAAFRQAVALRPDAETYTHLADTLGFALQRWDEAESLYRQAIALEGDQTGWSLMAVDGLVELLATKKRSGEAIALYQQLIKRSPQDPTPYEKLGDLYREQQQLPEATKAYRQFVRLVQTAKRSGDPNLPTPPTDDFGVYFKLAGVLKDQQQWNEAIQVYRQILVEDPNQKRAYMDLGAALEQTNQLDQAIAAYRQALQRTPEPDFAAFIHNDIGLVLQRQGKLRESAQAFKQAVQLLPNYDEAQENLKRVEQQLRSK